MKKNLLFAVCSLLFTLTACVTYTTPARDTWTTHLRGASFADMTPTAQVAKRPVYLGAGGVTVANGQLTAAGKNTYGAEPDMETVVLKYMAALEYELYDALRKPGISVQRAGTDVVVLLVRDALMQMDAAEFSTSGVDTLKIISKILQKYNATYLEIAGYTDSFTDTKAARALSLDMAQRVAVYMSQNKIITARMFIVGRGAARPIAAQDDIGRLTNRRVEIRISPVR